MVEEELIIMLNGLSCEKRIFFHCCRYAHGLAQAVIILRSTHM